MTQKEIIDATIRMMDSTLRSRKAVCDDAAREIAREATSIAPNMGQINTHVARYNRSKEVIDVLTRYFELLEEIRGLGEAEREEQK